MPDTPDQLPDSDSTIPVSKPVASIPRGDSPDLPLPEELTALLPAGTYHVESFLGRGGMGAVYKGVQTRLQRLVAIKIMRRDQDRDSGFEQRFQREALAMAELNHPHIVSVIDYGEAGPDYLYIVMELVDGADLMDVIRTGRMTQEMALTLLPQICDALQFAHDHGIVHRDIKPSNIMLTRDGRIKIADFGLAKNFDIQNGFRTKEGASVGTPDYAAPEQLDPKAQVDHRADIYALGVMIYQMITGHLPRGAWRPPSLRAEVDPKWDEIVSHAMAADPKDRYGSATEVKTDVSHITPSGTPVAGVRNPGAQPAASLGPSLEKPGTARSRALLILGALVAVVAIVAGVVYGPRSAPLTRPAAKPGVWLELFRSESAVRDASTGGESFTWEDGWIVPEGGLAQRLAYPQEFGNVVMRARFKARGGGMPENMIETRTQSGTSYVFRLGRDGTPEITYMAPETQGQPAPKGKPPSGGPPSGLKRPPRSSAALARAEQPLEIKAGDEYLMEFSLVGSRLMGRVNGQVVCEATDSRLVRGGINVFGYSPMRDVAAMSLEGLDEGAAAKAMESAK